MSPASRGARTPAGRPARLVAIGLAVLAATVALTWLLEHVMPAPYSGLLAAVLVGLAVTELVKRQPRQRASRLFHAYFRARERGAGETAARERLLQGLARDAAARQRLARQVEAGWAGASERDRVLGGVRTAFAHQRTLIDAEVLAEAYDRARDRFTIPGWDALPKPFVDELRGRLDERAAGQLDALAEKYGLFQQRFFKRPTALGGDPAASVGDLARLLHSLGNRVSREDPGDAERAYRVSLSLRPDENLAHAGLALVLERTGRTREAARQAKQALAVLDGYAARAQTRDPTPEDIGPFASPRALREALEKLAAG